MANQIDLKEILDKVKLQIAGYQQVLFPQKAATLGEQKRANRAERADQHPDMVLEIGNELLITEEVIRTYRGLSNSLGRTVIIDQLPTPPDESIKASAFGIQVYVDMKTARQLRAAYLHREQTAS